MQPGDGILHSEINEGAYGESRGGGKNAAREKEMAAARESYVGNTKTRLNVTCKSFGMQCWNRSHLAKMEVKNARDKSVALE